MRVMLELFLSSFLFLLCTQAVLVKGCIEAERNALLAFKAGLIDPKNRLSSWEGKNCCTWSGVACSNKTGRVSKLSLRYSYDDYKSRLSGEISSSLPILSDLEHLDLSGNNFTGTYIPPFIGSFKRLRYLNLSYTDFLGNLPSQLGNLTNLHYLDLDGAIYTYRANKIWWLRGLTSLKYLDLSWTNLSATTNWFHVVNTLPSLEVLHLSDCNLPSINVSLAPHNLTKLKVPNGLSNITSIRSLDLSFNELSGLIPFELSFLSNIEVLVLNFNNFEGIVPNTFSNLCSLNTLDLSYNNFSDEIQYSRFNELSQCKQKKLESLLLSGNAFRGNLSGWLEKMTNLVTAHLSWNSLNGMIPEGVWKLPFLTELFLGQNVFEGVITEVQLGYLRSIKSLGLSNNKLVVQSDHWHPDFELEYVGLDSCQVGPKFPSWLQGQTQLVGLSLSNNNITDTLPQWFRNITHSMSSLDLSDNQIKGKLSFSLLDTKLTLLNLSFNLIEGSLKEFSSEGSLEEFPSLYILDLRNNNIVGSIPSSICKFQFNYLFLSNNKLSGELPECLEYSDVSFPILDFANNNLSGNISSFYCSAKVKWILNLNNNNFSGELPICLKNSSELEVLDLGENNFTGTIPTWIGETFRYLIFLNLRSNMFHGSIPPQLGQLQSLQILDLSHNNLSGKIPTTVDNFSKMVLSPSWFRGVQKGLFARVILPDFFLSLTIKNENLEFSIALFLMTSIDFSNNGLSGEIPAALGDLTGLHNLNLSNNHLSGKIPETIGKMKSLESLDLSINGLSGSIPQTLSELTFLSLLNLSYNNLSGVIPTGHQLQTLTDPASIYMGNPFLCGPEISKNCTVDKNKTDYNSETQQHEDGSDWLWLYIGTLCGFVMGFWSLFGTLILKRDWRHAYIYMIDAFIDRVYVAGALFLARIMRNFRKLKGSK